MAKVSEILNNLLDYLERSRSERVPDFDPSSLSGTVRRIIEYLERRERDFPPQERAEEDVDPDAPGVLAIGGNLVGRKTPAGWILATTESPKEPELLSDEGEVEGGTLVTDPAIIPDKDKGWIYKYTRAGVEEIAHADPRDEVVYDPAYRCGTIYAFDARGHCIGWWNLYTGTWTWESPWGFDNPGTPPA